jgi:prepilin-type N-terminal cleavage/methylation domain-containing protein
VRALLGPGAMASPVSCPRRPPVPSPVASRDQGFTFVEVMVSLGLFALLTVMGASLLVRTTSFVTESVLRSDLMETAKIAQERVFDQLFSAKVMFLGVSAGQPTLTVVLPLELPVGGGPAIDFFDGNGQVNWGVVEPAGPQLDQVGSPHRLTITVVPGSVLAEKDCGLDLNYDGDLLDSFQLGSLQAQTTAGPLLSFVVNRLVLSEVGRGAFDIDGDMAIDPLFQLGGETFTDSNANGVHDGTETYVDKNTNTRWDGTLSLNLLTVRRDRESRCHRFVYKASVKLLNN